MNTSTLVTFLLLSGTFSPLLLFMNDFPVLVLCICWEKTSNKLKAIYISEILCAVCASKQASQ